MAISWKRLTFLPNEAAIAELKENWSWLVPPKMEPFMFATSGDVFYQADDESIFWLDTGQGAFKLAASTTDSFLTQMKADGGVEWLMTPVIDELFNAGAEIKPDQCFGYKVLPVLGGEYSCENMVPMSASAWYGFSGYLHSQLKDLPNGTSVKLTAE